MPNTMSTETAPSNLTVNPLEYLQVTLNPEGTLNRDCFIFPDTSATPDPTLPAGPVLSKDVPINPSHNTWARIFLPHHARSCSAEEKLPLIVYYHGGGFILGSPASNIFHEFCVALARELSTVVVSVKYRLAPEHRLPLAFDDAVEALHWVKNARDEWLTDHADLSTCYLMGSSAGGNLAFHAGLRASASQEDLEPLKIRGLILHHPFFGGTQRTPSELRLENDQMLPLAASDLMWELSLPLGVSRDHEYCNSAVYGGSKLSEGVDEMRSLGCRILITGCDGDPLIDRQVELAKLLKEKGAHVVSDFSEGGGGYHGIEFMEPDKIKPLIQTLQSFMSPTGTGQDQDVAGPPDGVSTQNVA
ncbi:carboxylesterase 1-like [Rhodamnia argentea]|uniref:Carboxylesterase 1-like n=1 Tax=Rhodamnia argentea TaxID=178133 RepID=A0ABM3GTI8_9MYRT|nr:carboxylesterase 1-like [Rhodamnia argentea]